MIGNMLIPLIMGGLFYVLFRPQSYLAQLVFRLTNNEETGRLDLMDFYRKIPLFVKNHLCDLLWAYALVFACCFAKDRHEVDLKKVLIAVGLFEILTETLQLIPAFHGTFDLTDIFLEFLASAAGAGMIRLKNKKERKCE